LEKFPGYEGENSKSSDFAAIIINQFAGADTQNAFTSGGYRPLADYLLKSNSQFETNP
jgi:hypothetical protein